MGLRTKILIVAAVLLAAPRATAEPSEGDVHEMPSEHMRLTTGPGELRGPDGKIYAIPQLSHIVTDEAWSKVDAEFRRLQEQETRLKAENESFRKSSEDWKPGWVVLTSVLATGIALGWYIGSRN